MGGLSFDGIVVDIYSDYIYVAHQRISSNSANKVIATTNDNQSDAVMFGCFLTGPLRDQRRYVFGKVLLPGMRLNDQTQ